MESQSSNYAVHVAAALGLPSFIREIVNHNPQLALIFDEHGLTPCHLAVANGHISVVKELLNSKMGIDICCMRDKCGFLPIQTAVMKGRVDVLKVVNDTCPMWMLRESTRQGDNILHLALKFDSLEAFCYLWPILSGDKKLVNSRDAEENTLLHIAVAKRQQEVVKMLVDKVDLNVVNLNGLTVFDILSNFGYKHGKMTLEEMMRRADWSRTVGHESSQPHLTRQPDLLQIGESSTQPSSPEAGSNILLYLQEKLFDLRQALSSRVPNDQDRETSNTLMVVATLIAAITFQSTLNPPGGFIQDGKNRGMAVYELYLNWYLLLNVMAFIFSLSVILLTIYAVPKWRDLIKLAKFIIWVSIYFTFMSFQYAIGIIFSNIIHYPFILAFIYIANGIVLAFALLMFVYSWYLFHKSMSTFLQARSTKGIVGKLMTIAIAGLSFFGAALVWLPFVMLDIFRYYLVFR